MFVVDGCHLVSGTLPPWLAAVRQRLSEGGAGASPETLGPFSALEEIQRVCETMLAGRGGPNEDDRKTLVGDVRAMRGSLGPKLVAALGPTLNAFVADLVPPRLATPQGARSVGLALVVLRERMCGRKATQAAWDDVVDAFSDDTTDATECEQRIRILREVCEARGHAWFDLGLSHRLSRLLSDDASEAEAMGALPPDPERDPRETAGLTQEQRIALCRTAASEEAERDDVAVWLMFRNAYVDGWQQMGPVQLFDARLMPDGIREGGNLEGIDGYVPPPELADWGAASVFLHHLGLETNELAVLARVWLPDALVEQAPSQARDLVHTLVEVAYDESQWVLQSGAVAYRFGGDWYGSLGFFDPSQLEQNRRAVKPVFERTREELTRIDETFARRLAGGDPAAAEAVEDARWVIAVARAPTAAQRVALGTRALERTLGIAQAKGEAWPDVTTRFLLAPWLQLERQRWARAAALNARTGVAKTHGRESVLYGWIDHHVFPRAEPGRSYPSAEGVATLEVFFGPLDATIARGLVENRLLRRALGVLNRSDEALHWLREAEDRFKALLARTERCRNAVIHGQRPSAGSLATVDEFVRDLGRLVAQESMRSAETGDAPLAQLERWRGGLAEQRALLSVGGQPLAVLFAG